MLERKYAIEGTGRLVKKSNGMPIPDEEPVFILRAKDINALPTLMAYVFLCQNLSHREQVMKSVGDFKDFQLKFSDRMIEPDS